MSTLPGGMSCFNIVADGANPNTFYAAVGINDPGQGVFRSVNGGLNWTNVSNGIGGLGGAAVRIELLAAKKKRAGILIEETKKRLERNPTDLQLRFELGEHLVNAQRFREAVPELQRARQNPNARLKAMNLLGLCYRELGMLDMAMKQFEDAAKEILTMDATKKDIVYNLGIVYERMGEREKSLNCMKQIYEADYGFKDVAERVESSYPQE